METPHGYGRRQDRGILEDKRGQYVDILMGGRSDNTSQMLDRIALLLTNPLELHSTLFFCHPAEDLGLVRPLPSHVRVETMHRPQGE